MSNFSHKVTDLESGLEVREIIRRNFDFSARLRNRIKREKLVYLNGEQSPGWYSVNENDVIDIILPEEVSHFEPQNIPIQPVYEDDDMLILNKQPGVTVHPTKGHPDRTIANGLMQYMQDTNQSFKIRFVNRLDMDTSGLLIVAKNSYCQNDLTQQMRQKQITKKYIALLCGILPDTFGTIDYPIGRPDAESVKRSVMETGAPSITHYRVMQRFELSKHTLAELTLETGRTHQIRVHTSHIGHPVLGDRLYGGENIFIIQRQALHAHSLSFIHPIKKEGMTLTAPLPPDILQAIKKLK